MNAFRKRKLIFLFRLYAVIDVLFSDRFELFIYGKNWEYNGRTRFDKNEILNHTDEKPNETKNPIDDDFGYGIMAR